MNVHSFEVVIGLEIHVRIKTQAKMFCACRNAVELASQPNTYVCPVCMGFPGALPRLNKEVVRLGVRAALLMGCDVKPYSRFDRKSYFYPDSPLSYQITQMYDPIAVRGKIKVLVDGAVKEFTIHHMHLENDAGKLIHMGGRTFIDFNRAGSPLMEIVTDPVFSSASEVVEFLKELQKIMRYGEVSDADMEAGQMRCDVNISVRKKGETTLGTRVEIKNVNSFSAIARAIEHESKRQIACMLAGGRVEQETRGWDDEAGYSTVQRTKEDAMDYRYFPEPDLLPVVLDEEYIASIRASLPELPIEKRIRYFYEYGLGEDDARILSLDRELAGYYDETVRICRDPKKACAYITTVIFSLLKEKQCTLQDTFLTPEKLADIICRINREELSSTNAKKVLEEAMETNKTIDEIIDAYGLRQENDDAFLESIVEEVLAVCEKQKEQYLAGHENVFGYLVGQCMKRTQGKGNPKKIHEILKRKLGK